MPSIGDLVVNLSANTTKFSRDISTAKKGVTAFGAAAAVATTAATAGLAALTAAAATAAAGLWTIGGRISDLAAIADKAAQTGLSGAFLQRLQYAADQSGVSIEGLEAGLKRLTLEMGKAGETITLEEKLQQIAAEMQALPNEAARAALAVKNFGKSGIEMTGLFAGGMSDLNKLLAEAKRLGIGIDDAALQRAADADDAIQRMKFSFSAMVDQLAVGLAPAFALAADKVTELLVPVTELLAKFNRLDDPLKFLGELLSAQFDVAIETVKSKWDQMLKDLLIGTLKAGEEMADGLAMKLIDPLGAVDMIGEGALQVAGFVNGGGQAAGAANPLDAAIAKRDALLNQLNKQNPEQPAVPPVGKGAAGLGDVTALFGKGQAAGQVIQMGLKGVFDRTEIQAGAWQGLLERWFAGGQAKFANVDLSEQGKVDKSQLAKVIERASQTGMKSGSSDAISTLVYSAGRNNPILAATINQTAAIKKGAADTVAAINNNALQQAAW